jgi:hypothetical protein
VNVSRRTLCSGLLFGLLLSACGSSTHSTSSSVLSGTTSSAPASTTTAATSTRTRTSATSTSTSTTAARTTTKKVTAPPPASGPRVPATYTIAAGGTLTPPTISIPAGYTVEITFVDHGGSTATATVRTPKPTVLDIPPGGESYALVSHLRKGTYPIEINGAERGSLVIGSSPGP